MHKWKIVLGTACLNLVLAGTAFAQMGGGMRQPQLPRALFNPTVGSGAQYEVTSPNGQKITMEVDVVGKESVNGKDGYWFETPVSTPRMQGMVMKMLLVMDTERPALTKMIMQMPGQAPMEMPQQMMRMGADQQKPIDPKNEVEDLGVEPVTTPAGTFDARHYRMKDGSGDAWISEKVTPYGLVKHQGSKGDTVILTKVITDAKDRITGTPVPFNPMMMGGAMGGGRGPQ
jgi:hypothetical protein